ncbi:GTP-binding protein [Streptomyces albipurpureus]|uniref:ATP/GTP-binding protein n=1 Tax=Streptomyces albipurpureus TaxID=2897419 RepID=A0ABT0UYR5_9ACTN|nr:ATP/GTP-binding protein [Streptomyces sp. CWNU-1]MCM2393615.1 ATP/GTP-binding protein [Streptomyces sp. CWNU-1]
MGGQEARTVAGPASLKIVVAGGFGAGKTTLIGAVSEIKPLRTEEVLTTASTGVDHLHGVEAKTTTTVSMDFGRITFDEPLPMVLFLFGTPGQERFESLWDDLTLGALGAVVLADTRRLSDSFTAVDYFESRGLPFLIAVNEFDGAHRYSTTAVRAALDLDPHVPVMPCDARQGQSAAQVLIRLIEHLQSTDHTARTVRSDQPTPASSATAGVQP